MKNITFLATTISVFAFSGVAHAQSTRPDTSTGISEIIVTAQRRAESLQKAAIPIDAVRGDALVQRGITNAADLTKAVPALSIPAPGGSVASIFIRGVGNITTSSYNDPAVTPSFDGVVLGRSGGMFGASFYDLTRVEVLKGPQGILYGRNATGGAINVLPARPELGKNGMGLNLAYGNYNQVDVDAHVNLATGEHSALRIAGALFSHDGYNKDGTDDAKRGSLRAQFLYEPSSDLSLRIGGDYSHVGGRGVGGDYLGSFAPSGTGYAFTPSGLSAGEGFNSAASNAYRKTQLGGPGMDFRQAMQSAPLQDITYWGIHAEANVQTPIGKLTVIPAYRETQEHTIMYAPAFNTGNVNESTNQTSLEARLAGKRGMMDYVLGGFYFKEKIRASNIYNQEFVLPIQNYRLSTESWAAFGQLTAHIGNSFRLVGGARYTHDTKSIDGLINNIIVSCANTTTPPFCIGQMPHMPNLFSADAAIGWLGSNGYINPSSGFTVPGSNATAGTVVYGLNSGAGSVIKTYNNIKQSSPFSRVTWKVSAEYDVTPTSLLYATVETGYRAGGYQMVDSPSKIQYKPEFITAFTVGSKNRFFNNRVQLNVEGFYWKYRDQQINYFTVDSNGTLISSSENAGRSTIKGFDVDLVVKPSSGTTLSGKMQYLDAVYDDLHLTSASPFDNFNCPSTLTGAFSNGAPVKSFNCSGRQLLFSPKWTVNLGAEQVIRVDEKRELVANVNTAWRDDQWAAFEFLDFERVAAYWTSDASLALRSAEGGWSLTAYVQNIENKRRNLAPQSSPMGFAIAHYSAPRTFGLRLSAKF